MSVITEFFVESFLRRTKMYSLVLAVLFANVAYLWYFEYYFTGVLFLFLVLGGTAFCWMMRSRDKLSPVQLVIVTGCDSGLGYSLALHCQSLGATVIAGVLRENGPGAKELQSHNIVVQPLDITCRKSVKSFGTFVRSYIEEKELVLRALVNNAGVMVFGEFEWQTEDQIAYQVEVNLLGTMRITKELMPIIRADSSRIIIVTSHCSKEPLPGVAVYSSTKAAINAWATSLRVELKKYGINVVCFAPGSFAHQSNILAYQKEHFNLMQMSMSEEAKDFYGNYFDKYTKYLTSFTRETGVRRLENPEIYEVFEGTIFDRCPAALYVCEPWRYFFYFFLCGLVPSRIRDRLIESFICMPVWQPNDRVHRKIEASSFISTNEEDVLLPQADQKSLFKKCVKDECGH